MALSCEHCGKCYSKKSKLERHMRIHTGERPYQCNACFKNFMNLDHLRQHLRTHTGFKLLCICGSRYRNAEPLARHQNVCSKVLEKSLKVKKQELQDEKKSKESKIENFTSEDDYKKSGPNEPIEGKRKYFDMDDDKVDKIEEADFADFICRYKQGGSTNVKISHKEEMKTLWMKKLGIGKCFQYEVMKCESNNKDEKSEQKCDINSKGKIELETTMYKENIKINIKDEHDSAESLKEIKTDEEQLIIDGNNIQSSELDTKYIIENSGAKNEYETNASSREQSKIINKALHETKVNSKCLFFCEICSKAFKIKYHMRRHKLTHSEVNHVICNKTFIRNGLLKNRMNIDTKEIKETFKCDFNTCDKEFTQKESLLRHFRSHTR